MLLFCVSCSKTEISDNEVTDIEDGITENEGTGNDAEKEADPDNNDVGVDYTAVVLEDGREIKLGAKADGVIVSLGEYEEMFEAPSCVHEGTDRVYTYTGFSVTTSPDENGDNIVTEVGIESSECKLANGLTVGSDVKDVEAVYGSDCTDAFGFITYTFDGVTISIVTDNGTISTILFSAARD